MDLRQTLVYALVALAMVGAVSAATLPTAPAQLIEGDTSTMDISNYGPVSVDAYAGNITGLVIYGISQTKTWQGFYGNVSGTITLDDANNFTFYNWSAAEPRGQIYATLNNSISWINVTCFNYSDATTNNATIEDYYRINQTDYDGVDETFNSTDHPLFQVGSRTMDDCPTTYVMQNDTYQQVNFVNILLYDPNLPETGWVYTTLIENKTPFTHEKVTCYNGELCDFQILVNDDGHGTDTNPTPYFFWVELI